MRTNITNIIPLLRRPAQRRAFSGLSQFLRVSEEVKAAVASGKPVVALESAIYTHGFPVPDNLALAREIEATVRANGAVPATICMLAGKAHVGLSEAQLLAMISTVRLSARAQATVATTYNSSPASNTGRRPKRSVSGPATSREIAEPRV